MSLALIKLMGLATIGMVMQNVRLIYRIEHDIGDDETLYDEGVYMTRAERKSYFEQQFEKLRQEKK